MHFLLDALTQSSPYSFSDMANIFTDNSTERKQLTFKVPLVLWRALKLRSMDANKTMTQLVVEHMAAVLGVELPLDDVDSVDAEEEPVKGGE